MTRYSAHMPATGIASFMRSPICEDLQRLDADVAVLGVPYDAGTGNRPGARFGPREIRSYSSYFGGWGGGAARGYWDIDKQKRMMAGVRVVDCGDVDVAYYDIERNFKKITDTVGKVLDRDALPVLLGGDHSITFPLIRAFERFAPLDIVHIDAHMDWIDHVDGIRYGNGSNMRRCMELPFVREMTHIGIRDARSREGDDADAVAAGARIFTRRNVRDRGVAAVVEQIPSMEYIYVTIDIDGLDPSIAPGTSSPAIDGLLYHELREILEGVAAKGRVVGFDLTEVNPYLDLHGMTCQVAVTVILEFLGAIFERPC